MGIRNKLDPEMLDTYWNFVYERQQIWWRRNIRKKPAPWTKDPVLQVEFITNMYRELDPGTQYIRETLLIAENDIPYPDKLFNLLFYTFIGRQDTTYYYVLQDYGNLIANEFKPKKLSKILHSLTVPFGDAYNVYPNVHDRSLDKIDNVCDLFDKIRSNKFTKFWKQVKNADTAEDVFKTINTLYGFGPFLSYQVYIDLCYQNNAGHSMIPFTPNDFVIAGPGAKRGVRLLKPDATTKEEVPIMKWLHNNQQKEFRRLGLKFKWPVGVAGNEWGRLWLSDIQNTLCEYQKFIRRRDNPRSTRKYRHGTA